MTNKELRAELRFQLAYIQNHAIATCRKIAMVGFNDNLTDKQKAEFVEGYKGIIQNNLDVVYEHLVEVLNIKEDL